MAAGKARWTRCSASLLIEDGLNDLSLRGVAALHRNLSISVCCADACALDRSRSFHRPAAGEALFRAEKGRKRLAPGRTSVRLLPPRSAALLGNRRPAPNSHIQVFGRCATPLALLAAPLLRRCAARSVKQRRLSPAVACDARRALRRVSALGPRIPARLASFSPFHSSGIRHRVVAALVARVEAAGRNPGRIASVEPTARF